MRARQGGRDVLKSIAAATFLDVTCLFRRWQLFSYVIAAFFSTPTGTSIAFFFFCGETQVLYIYYHTVSVAIYINSKTLTFGSSFIGTEVVSFSWQIFFVHNRSVPTIRPVEWCNTEASWSDILTATIVSYVISERQNSFDWVNPVWHLPTACREIPKATALSLSSLA